MKRTLAYSEEERIPWTDLFDLFAKPTEKPPVEPLSADNIRNPNKDRGARLISNGSSWSQQQLTPPNNLQAPNPPQNTGSNVNISPAINAVSIPSNIGPSTPTPSGFGGRQTINSSSGAMVRP